MNFNIPTVSDIVKSYSNFNSDLTNQEELEKMKSELLKLTKDELVEQIINAKKVAKTDTVQDLAKAILKDEDLIAVNYEDIAAAIRLLKPGAKTSSKSIASYVSKKRDEWDLPQRIRISVPRAKVAEAPETEETEEPETEELEVEEGKA